MIEALLVLLVFQLVGEAITHAAGLPLPGPVLGLILFTACLKAAPKLAQAVSGAAHGILRNLSLLFVPAGVGVMQHMDLVMSQWLPILGALLISTAATLLVTAFTFTAVRRLTGNHEPAAEREQA